MLNKLKRTFSAGGVNVKISRPSKLTKSGPTLPITLTLTNRTKEERTVDDVLVELREKPEQGSGNTSSQGSSAVQHRISEAITLQPDQTHEFAIDLPTTHAGAAEAMGVDLPGWMKTASNALGSGKGGSREYEVCATPNVQGFKGARTFTLDLGKGFTL